MKRILICGLPGAGKTFLAKRLQEKLGNADWYNADAVREEYNDWDFSDEGRARQMERMKRLSNESIDSGKYAITDFVCPTNKLRQEFNADFVIWMNTISEGRFEDTNKVFENPDAESVDITITEDDWWNTQFADTWSERIITELTNG